MGINLSAGDLLVGSTPCVAAAVPKVCSNAPAAARHTSSAFSAGKREARGSTAHQSTCRGSGGGTKKRALRSAAEVAGPPVELSLRVGRWVCQGRPRRGRPASQAKRTGLRCFGDEFIALFCGRDVGRKTASQRPGTRATTSGIAWIMSLGGASGQKVSQAGAGGVHLASSTQKRRRRRRRTLASSPEPQNCPEKPVEPLLPVR